VVYRATQMHLELPVALKVIRPEWAHDLDFRERFKREARLAASLRHPNVVSPHDFDEHEGFLFAVMPLIDGPDLGTLIEREGPLVPRRAVAIIAQIADALDAAHALGLVHRDVKPANILIAARAKREHALLTDFGVARLVSSETRLTRVGQLAGTPGYVAPEQIHGEELGPQTDVYALGCVLCEALTGAVPYPRKTPEAMLIAHAIDSPPRVSERTSRISEAFDEIVARALAKKPEDRYETAGGLAEVAQRAAGYAEGSSPTTPPKNFLTETSVGLDSFRRIHVSDAQRRVLVALCRPTRERTPFARPATNREIAEELFVTVETVKTHLRVLFDRFGLHDLPQNQKRSTLATIAMRSGLISDDDFERN
jgi:serine/threonine protein kinase